MATAGQANHVCFTLDLPPSINDVYTISRPNVHSNTSRIEIKTEWKLWRSGQQRAVKMLHIGHGSLVRCDLWLFYPYWYKNGKLRRVDSHNMVKFVIDTITQKQDFDDSVIKFGSWGSEHDPDRPRVAVRLTEVVRMIDDGTLEIRR